MANLYFNERLSATDFEVGAVIEVTGDEARHAVRVSRLRLGEQTSVGNGAGMLGEGLVEELTNGHFAVRLDAVRRDPEPSIRLVLVQALAKGDRAERAIEQATEFGVDAVIPWEATRSVSRWGSAGGDKATRGVAKWQRTAREAAKQSIRTRIPDVLTLVDLDEICRFAARDETVVLVLHPQGSEALSGWAQAGLGRDVTEILVVIGPEGGFAPEELAALEHAGSKFLRLGDAVLRTSSAGPAALSILNVALGRW